jgi:hypothetical protein
VRIEQRVSLTRTVFEASLVIDNSALEALSGVAVELTVLDAARRPVALAVFNVTRRAAPLLDSANATLAPGSQAELVWLLAPQDSAAPRDPTDVLCRRRAGVPRRRRPGDVDRAAARAHCGASESAPALRLLSRAARAVGRPVHRRRRGAERAVCARRAGVERRLRRGAEHDGVELAAQDCRE